MYRALGECIGFRLSGLRASGSMYPLVGDVGFRY